MEKKEDCNCDCLITCPSCGYNGCNSKEPTVLEKEWSYLNILYRRVELAERLLSLIDNNGNQIYSTKWVKENIVKI